MTEAQIIALISQKTNPIV